MENMGYSHPKIRIVEQKVENYIQEEILNTLIIAL